MDDDRWWIGEGARAPSDHAAEHEEERVVIDLGAEERRLAQLQRDERSAAERRAAAMAIIEHGLETGDVRDVTGLLLDPDPDIRVLAVRAIGDAERGTWDALVPALDDPVDEVRAAAVEVLGRDPDYLPDLIPLACSPGWPRVGRAALVALPELVRSSGLRDEELVLLLRAVAAPAVAPAGPDAETLGDLADVIGVQRLSRHLGRTDEVRLGAVRLLVAEGTEEALRTLADLVDDPDEEVRVSAESAARYLGEAIREEAEEDALVLEDQGVPVSRAGALATSEDEMIRRLADGLVSPDPSTRDRALADLGQLNWDHVLGWVRTSLHAGDDETAAGAARVAERLMLSSVAASILQRAAAVPEPDRGPFVSALLSFDLSADALVGALDEVPARHRPEAVGLVWRLVGRPALDLLIEKLDDASGGVRRAVLTVFAEADGPRSFEAAMRALDQDPSAAVRRQALSVLAHADHAGRLASLRTATRDSSPSIRLAAIRTLAPGLGEAAGPVLLAALDDRDEDVRKEAAGRLAGFVHADPDTVWGALRAARRRERKILVEALEREGTAPLARLALAHATSSDPEDRALSMRLGRRAGTPACVQAQIRALQDPVPAVRLAAARALSSAADSAAISALGSALRDPDPEVRVVAVQALAEIDDEAVLEHLVTALEDPDASVREAVVRVLGDHGSQQLARRLGEALGRPSVREAAAELLAGMGPVASELLVDALMERPADDRELSRIVGRALGRVTNLGELSRWLGSVEVERRHRGVEAIAAIGGPEAATELVRALGDPDVGVRLRTLHRLGDLGDPRVAEAVRRSARSDPVTEVAETARATLRRIAPEEPAEA